LIPDSLGRHKMSCSSKTAMGSEAERVHCALEKGENPLSEEEKIFIQTYCQIMKIDEKQKIDLEMELIDAKKYIKNLVVKYKF
jgi:hypothetical protein